MKITRLIISGLIVLLSPLVMKADNVTVQASVLNVDANVSPYNQVQPGDTVFLLGGTKTYLILQNFTGSFNNPITIMNKTGKVIINTTGNYGIDIKNCRYIHFTGTGDPLYYYGVSIERVTNGAGLSMGYLSSDCEMDHIYIANTNITGIFAKTDPDCSLVSSRANFTQYNTIIHDCYIFNTAVEGMYVGSSFYSGKTLTCNGTTITVLPSLLDGVKIYNNIVRYTGWDGIQVGSASTNCQIFNNLVMYDSQTATTYQMSGILIGGGSRCDCYNNYIYRGKGDGIESLGLGNYKIYNNAIVDAGYNYTAGPKYGIYVNDNSAEPGSSFTIMFNNIINPRTNGIKFMSTVTSNNLIASNAIINPGAGST
ncbi:MAG: right-handed parallel beta-helix repeat-containing protein, partial [Syntrophothermus sp.]